jgi:hypothetical protein
MGWDKGKPTGSADAYLVDDQIRDNWSAIQATLGSALSTGTALFDTSVGHTHDGSDSRLASKQLGAWSDKSSSYGAQVAATDGFVLVTAIGAPGGTAAIYSDDNATPVQLRAQVKCATADYTQSCMSPVRKGDYWRVVFTTTTPVSVFWIPMGC